MSAAAAGRVGRFYTAARRHPWVLGKVADWKIPLGPYTPAQIAVAVGGGFLLVKTISWWSWLGPVPIAAWLLAIWAVRRPKIRGRAPMQAALGWCCWAGSPAAGGSAGGPPATALPTRCSAASRSRTPPARPFGGRTVPTRLSGTPPGVPRPSPAAGRPSTRRRAQPAAPAVPVGPVSGVQQLLALAEQGGGVR